jgi:hypothetical protein
MDSSSYCQNRGKVVSLVQRFFQQGNPFCIDRSANLGTGLAGIDGLCMTRQCEERAYGN